MTAPGPIPDRMRGLVLTARCKLCGETFIAEWFEIHLDRDHGIDPKSPATWPTPPQDYPQ